MPHLRKLNYDALTSFEPVCNLASTPQVIVVNNESPYRTLAELFDAARVKPGTLTLASPGPAGAAHVTVEMLKRAASVDMTYVPYPGIAPALNALLGGHVTAAMSTYFAVAQHIRAGQLRALAAPSAARIETLPDVPTLTDLGYKDLEADLWYGLFAPARLRTTPSPSSPAGSRPRCVRPRSSRSSTPRGWLRSRSAARILAPSSASSPNDMVAAFATRISRRSKLAPAPAASEHLLSGARLYRKT